MATWTVEVTRENGEQLIVNCVEGCTVWDIMSDIKRAWGVPKRKQSLCVDTEVLVPRRRSLGIAAAIFA